MNWKQAENVLVAGVNSPVRAYRHVEDDPVMIQRAEGAEMIDVQGNRYIDFIMGWGPLILGHAHPEVVEDVREAATRGMLYGLSHPAEVELAAAIIEAVPGLERIRFAVSGTEACMTGVRLARAVTGRNKMIMIEGGYHGHSDIMLGSDSAGIPESIGGDILKVPYGDAPALQKIFAEHSNEIACLVAEPVAANMGVMQPDIDFLKLARQLTADAQALLIFDEVVTGFRLHYGCAQTLFEVSPDLTVFGKIIGGGLPVGALGGPWKLMRHLAPEGKVYHGGTFAGSPMTMAGGLKALEVLKRPGVYDQLDRLAASLQDGLRTAAKNCGLPLQINRQGSMLTAFFAEEPVRGVDAVTLSRRDLFAQWIRGLKRQGVLAPPSPYEGWFISTAHTEEHIARVVMVSEKLFAEMVEAARS